MSKLVIDAVSGFGMALIKPITDLISEVVEDKDKANSLAHEIATLAARQAQEVKLAQLEVNKVEAAHKSMFVAGWRPFCGWACSFSLAFNYLIAPLANAFGADLITLDLNIMLPVLLGMLGLGGLRTVEKNTGVAREV